jgi:hypothetical protein
VLQEIRVDILRDERLRFGAALPSAVIHQKYPSCFFFSMLAA